ncbi:Synapse-associated protein 1 [Podochytrium sp. JEL0797]|nr:Synapse-associated protein 1 [Podochytrium sp. JEL0797]
MSAWFAKAQSLASSVASTVTTTLTTLEHQVSQASSDLAQQHRMTVEAKRSQGDLDEEDLNRTVVETAVPEAVRRGFSGLFQMGGGEKGDGKEGKAKVQLPWEVVSGVEAQEELRGQICALSQEKRNFLVSPPEGTDFTFDMKDFLPVALAILQTDKLLEKMRFDLVPKQIKDEPFFQNYFYRVHMLQQSALLLSPASADLAVVSVNGGEEKPGVVGWRSGSGREEEGGAGVETGEKVGDGVVGGLVAGDGDIPGVLSGEEEDGEEEYASTESFGADWERELQNELDEV